METPLDDELVEVLFQSPSVRIERITSQGHSSPPGFWYDQQEHEWVTLVSGEARLQFADEPTPRCLNPGDHVLIPAHRKHRVVWTAPSELTVWICVFTADDPLQPARSPAT